MEKFTRKQLKKYGLKAVKFSKLTNGDEFNIPVDFDNFMTFSYDYYRRKLVGDTIEFADGQPMSQLQTAAAFAKDYKVVFVKA